MNLPLAAHDAGDSFAISDVFFGKDALREGAGIFVGEDRNGALQNDDAVIEMFIDEVHGAAGPLDAIVKGLLLRIEAGKCGKQRRMDVEDAIGKGCDEIRREQAHVASQNYKVDAVFAKAGDDVGVMFGAWTTFGNVESCRNAELACGGQAGRVGDVGDRYRDFNFLKFSSPDRIGDRKEVRAAAGEQHSHADGRMRALRA